MGEKIGRVWGGPRELGRRFGKSFVRCNDRALRRREDARDERTGGAQRSVALSMLEYSRYCSERPGVDNDDPRVSDAPFYANGLQHGVFNVEGGERRSRVGSGFIDGIRLTLVVDAGGVPAPAFTRHATRSSTLAASSGRYFRNAPPGARDEMATSLSAGLSKVFVGPCGTVTRLHQDCANAHAWLGQASGRKLFVCYCRRRTPSKWT